MITRKRMFTIVATVLNVSESIAPVSKRKHQPFRQLFSFLKQDPGKMKTVLRIVSTFLLLVLACLMGCSGLTKLESRFQLMNTEPPPQDEEIHADGGILQYAGSVNYHQEDTILHSKSLETIALMIGVALFMYIAVRV